MPINAQRLLPVLCLTQDGTGLTHAEQAGRLSAAGATWIQLRMKDAPRDVWRAEASAAAKACHRNGALLIVNDSVDIALASGADGVHLGQSDGDWREARRELGPQAVIGGTVNTADDARRAAASGCLDYVGVGPLRFTSTKQNLSPVLGIEGIRALVGALRGLPSWVIGGVVPGDLPQIRDAGAAGAAVSSALHLGGRLEDNLRAFLEAWPVPAEMPS